MLGGIMGGGGGGLGNIAGGITGGGGMSSPSPMSMVGKAADALGNFLPQKTEYAGDKGHITAGMDGVYDGISDAAMNFPPVGTMVGGIMKAGKLVGKAANALGAGTDGMTTADAILGSSFLNLTPIGLINGIFGKKADTFTKDTEVFGEMGSGYGGSNKQADLAAHKSGKKYGAFSARARRKANAQISEAKRQQEAISDIQDDVHNQKMLAASMTDTMGRAYQNKLQGGYQQGAIRAAKYGGILFSVEATRRAAQIVRAQQGSKLETTEIKKLETYNWPKYIAKDDKFMEFISTLPEEWKEYIEEHEDLYEIWRENGKPKSFSDSTDKLRTPLFILDDSGNTIINPEISEAEDTSKETTKEEPMSEDDFVMEVQKLQDEVESFQKGGQLNVIPEGALHAHKHNLEDIREDLDGEITHKGIPVVSISEDGKVEQQAEIERNEIIFNLEVTKQIEELRKQYEKAETQKEKDAIAIEAGKILSDSIIEDTDDRTNLIKQVD